MRARQHHGRGRLLGASEASPNGPEWAILTTACDMRPVPTPPSFAGGKATPPCTHVAPLPTLIHFGPWSPWPPFSQKLPPPRPVARRRAPRFAARKHAAAASLGASAVATTVVIAAVAGPWPGTRLRANASTRPPSPIGQPMTPIIATPAASGARPDPPPAPSCRRAPPPAAAAHRLPPPRPSHHPRGRGPPRGARARR